MYIPTMHLKDPHLHSHFQFLLNLESLGSHLLTASFTILRMVFKSDEGQHLERKN